MGKFKKKNIKRNEKGFASIEFIFLMGFSIIILTGFFNVLYMEFQRNSALSSLRDAASAGTRIADLKTASSDDINKSIDACEARGKESLNQTMGGNSLDVKCEASVNDSGQAVMKAELVGSPTSAVLVPWVAPWKELRLKDLNSIYVQREAARDE